MVKFIGSYDRVDQMPTARITEYAFIGRSNVGKSSLLNALVGQRVARTSNTPGRTQLINVFEWQNVILTDLPGYGYARAAKTDIAHWRRRLEKYLTTRNQLTLLFILIDARHGLKPSDLEIMNFCDANAVKYQLVMTKLDKARKTEIEQALHGINSEIVKHGACVADVIITSAEKKTGIADLENTITGNPVV